MAVIHIDPRYSIVIVQNKHNKALFSLLSFNRPTHAAFWSQLEIALTMPTPIPENDNYIQINSFIWYSF